MEPMHERERDRIRVRPKREGPGRARAVIAPRFEHRGQSMTESALFMPILLLMLLGAFNLGMAIRAQLQLAQLVQQAAQYLVHHPDYADEFVVTLTGATGGSFTLTTSGGTPGTTAAIASNATAATVQADLATLSDVGVGNVAVTSLAPGGPFAVTFRGTATATGLTASGSSLTPTGANVAVTSRYKKLVDYMNSLSSYSLTPLEVSLTVGKSCTADNGCVQQDTVTVNYPFPVLFPLIGKLSVGTLGNGVVHLGATASTVAATHQVLPYQSGADPVYVCSVSPTHNCPDLTYRATGSNKTIGQHEVIWGPPVEAWTGTGDLALPVSYCIQRYWQDSAVPLPNSHIDTYYGGTDSPVNSLNCVAGHNAGTYMYFIDPANFSTSGTDLGANGVLSYTITTIQANGLQSAAETGSVTGVAS